VNKKYFTYEESPYHSGLYTITPNFDLLPLKYTTGSYNILCARLMSLSYPQYLRMCRDILGAEVIGKNSLYPVAYFKRDNSFIQFIKLLNARAELAMYEREHPYNIVEKDGVLVKENF
jgi:hypothetical protein